MIFKFIRLIPAFFRLFRDYEMTPEDIRFSLEQYTRVIDRLTGGRMSKINYYADDIVSVVNDFYCDGCEYKDGEQE